MIALALCGLALVICYLAGRRSLGFGLVAVLAFGYFYGILRANLLTAASHFIFDAGLLGLYLARWQSTSQDRKFTRPTAYWTAILILWPALLLLMPFQPLMISLVGLRGNIYFIPLLLLGSRLKGKDFIQLSAGLAVLDMIAVVFGGAEYFLGIQRFYPVSPVTQIIYMSSDVAGGYHRIPAIFSSAHAYGGTMVASIPFLVGLWMGAETSFYKLLGLLGVPAAFLGVLLSATRQNFIYSCAMILFVLFVVRMKGKHRVLFLVILGALALAAMSNARFQRFKTLDDTESVASRIAGSVNRTFWDILTEYPMGNGLGGGGTSMPYFLQGQVRNPIGMENEYARILCEQGIIGLVIWLSFLVWVFSRVRVTFAKGQWAIPKRLMWGFAITSFGTAWIGTGLLTSIPATVLLVMGMGWIVVPSEDASAARDRVRPSSHRSVRTPVPVLR